ncbi:MAG: FAD-dependent oxidoreductase [Deltaproteobacteria bacterium]|nr:MAG: FAD-dependent oxidoreductase [Deltaproteobacteria bacterium]
MPPAAFGALVVGGGVSGLATAWQLARRGVPRVGLVERFRLHHDRGSSHGTSRITRSTYSDERYVRLVRVAHAEEWPRLERESGATLIHRCDGIFFGPPEGDIERWADAVAAAGAPGVERLTPAEARARFPAFATRPAEWWPPQTRCGRSTAVAGWRACTCWRRRGSAPSIPRRSRSSWTRTAAGSRPSA